MTAREFHSRLIRRARRVGFTVSSELADGLWTYYELLSRWNRKINLTALDSLDEAIDRLLLEPLLAVRYLSAPVAAMLDVGSGGGSPAIPMKLAAPQASLVMVESKVRKSAFLREAIRQLGLNKTRVETLRYEELLTRPDLHEALDIVTLRAVRVETRTLIRLQAFLRPGGEFFLFRGPGGPDVPTSLTPPLVWRATHPLVEALRSRLVVIAKRPVGSYR